jgi:hypothetical protein
MVVSPGAREADQPFRSSFIRWSLNSSAVCSFLGHAAKETGACSSISSPLKVFLKALKEF